MSDTETREADQTGEPATKERLNEKSVECSNASDRIAVSAEDNASIKTVVADVDWAIERSPERVQTSSIQS